MTKADLIAALATKYFIVRTPVLQSTEGDLNWYTAKVYDKIDEALREGNISFWVQNDGISGETAYWSPAEPKPAPTTTFVGELEDYIGSKITAGVIEGGFITYINESNEIAYGIAIVDQAGTLVEKKVFLDKDSGGNLQHRVVP